MVQGGAGFTPPARALSYCAVGEIAEGMTRGVSMLSNRFLIAAMILTPAPLLAQEAEDSSRWRYLSSTDQAVVLINDDVDGRTTTKTVTTYTAFAEPHSSGAVGYATSFEVDCRMETINDLGSVAHAADRELGRMPSQTADGAVQYKPGTLFGDVAAFACLRRVASEDRRVTTGRDAAVEYARKRASRSR